MKTKTLTGIIMAALLAIGLITGCNSIPEGTQVGVSGNSTNVSASLGLPVGDAAIVTATGTINPSNPSDWTVGIVVTLRGYTTEALEAIASVPGAVYNRNDPRVFYIPDDGSLVASRSRMNQSLLKLLSMEDAKVSYINR